ncbi:MAG: hypothetical protein AAF914_13140 [Pseudomonadota bacterium]
MAFSLANPWADVARRPHGLMSLWVDKMDIDPVVLGVLVLKGMALVLFVLRLIRAFSGR